MKLQFNIKGQNEESKNKCFMSLWEKYTELSVYCTNKLYYKHFAKTNKCLIQQSLCWSWFTDVLTWSCSLCWSSVLHWDAFLTHWHKFGFWNIRKYLSV